MGTRLTLYYVIVERNILDLEENEVVDLLNSRSLGCHYTKDFVIFSFSSSDYHELFVNKVIKRRDKQLFSQLRGNSHIKSTNSLLFLVTLIGNITSTVSNSEVLEVYKIVEKSLKDMSSPYPIQQIDIHLRPNEVIKGIIRATLMAKKDKSLSEGKKGEVIYIDSLITHYLIR